MARRSAAVGAAVFASALVAALGVTTDAAASTPTRVVPAPAPVADETTPLLAAMQRDLGLTAAQARTRLAAEDLASRSEATLRTRLGASFAGAWLAPDTASLVVAVTDAARAGVIRQAGARPVVVARSARQLDAARTRLDRVAARAPGAVTSWHVDVASNAVVVVAAPGGAAAAGAFVAASGADRAAVRVVTSAERPVPLFDIRGGEAYFIDNRFRCSIGLSVVGGFVTAGHCGGPGAQTAGFNRVAQGTVQGSSFPGNDYGWVRVNANWTPRPVVNNNGGNVQVAGSRDAAVGSSVCRSGSTTGWHCGTIQARNATVNYPQGTVTGLVRTNVCAEGGDSGGSWISGNQAQGVTSGGSGNCTTGGTTFFQPVNEILSVFGLRLVTTGGTPPPPPPPPPGPPPPPPPPGGSWQPGTSYAIGAQVTFAGASYRCIQAHTSQVGWEPPNVPALWQRL